MNKPGAYYFWYFLFGKIKVSKNTTDIISVGVKGHLRPGRTEYGNAAYSAPNPNCHCAKPTKDLKAARKLIPPFYPDVGNCKQKYKEEQA